MVIDASFNLDPVVIDGTSWSMSDRSILCGPGAAVSEFFAPGDLYFWAAASDQLIKDAYGRPLGPKIHADILKSHFRSISESAQPLKWERGTYRLSELILMRPLRSTSDNAGRQQFELLTRCSPWPANRLYMFYPKPPADDDLRKGGSIGANVAGPV